MEYGCLRFEKRVVEEGGCVLAVFDGKPPDSYEEFEATSLYCSHCKEAVPVRKKLLLILPDGDQYEYLCVRCGSSVGMKSERGKEGIKILM